MEVSLLIYKLKLHVFATGPIGMVSALVQTNPEAMNAELADQDLEAVDECGQRAQRGRNQCTVYSFTQSVANESYFMIVTDSVQSTFVNMNL